MKRLVILVAAFFAVMILVGLWMRDSSPGEPGQSGAPGKSLKLVTRSSSSASSSNGEVRARAEVPALPIQANPEPPGTLRLQGQVIDDGELPLEGATVLIDSVPPRSATTERDGTFLFVGLAPRTYQLEARKQSGHAGPVAVALNEKTEPVILRVKPASSVRVSVVDARQRKGIAQASVELRGSSVLTATTDGEGHTRLEGLAAGRYVAMASAPGYAPAFKSVSIADSSSMVDQVTLELSTGASAAGTVVDGRGQPVAGARVMAEPASSLAPLVDPQRDAVLTDARGAWRFPALAAGSYRFVASAEESAPGTSRLVSLDGLRAEEGIVITLPESARLSGRVLTRKGDPVGFATVRAVVDEGTWGQGVARQTLTDASGAFTLAGLPRRRISVVALHEVATSETQTFDLSAEPARDGVVLALDADESISGFVVDADNKPVAEAVVQADPAALAARSRTEVTLRGPRSTVADSGGNFELKGLRPGSYLLRAAPPGTSLRRPMSWMRPAIKAESGKKGVVLRLEMDGSVKGVVRRKDNAPVESFNISLGTIPVGTAFADPSGAFSLGGVPAGTYALTLTSPSFMTQVIQGVQVRSGQTADLGVIEVQPGRRVTGRVLRGDGSPAPGALVTVSKQLSGVYAGPAGAMMGDVKQATTGEDGSFMVDGLSIRPLVIGAEHPTEGRSTPQPLLEGVTAAQVEIVLKSVGSARGTVTRGGEPVGGAVVIATAKGTPAGGSGVSTGTDGSYQFDSLVPGKYTLVAMFDNGAGQQIKQAMVEIKTGETAKQDFELPRGQVALVVQAAPPPPTSPPPVGTDVAQVFLADVRSGGTTQDPSRPPPNVRSQTLTRTEPARFSEVVPGSYQLCVVGKKPPSEGGGGDGSGGSTTKPQCQFVAIKEQPAEQQLTVQMP